MGNVAAWTFSGPALRPANPAPVHADVTPEQFTLVGLLVSIGVAGAAGKWVFGWVYHAMVEDRDYWRDRALAMLGLADMATDEAEKRERRR